MWRVMAGVSLAFVMIAMASCAAGKQPTGATPTPTASAASTSVTEVEALDQRFTNENLPLEKLRLATQLARLSGGRSKYAEYIEQAAISSLQKRAQLAKATQQRETRSMAGASQRRNEESVLTSSGALISDRKQSATIGANRVSVGVPSTTDMGETTDANLDATALAAVMALSMSGQSDGKTLLLAVRSGNDQIACEAALGLAKLKRMDAIPEIARAARASDDPFPCAQALVYFGDRSSDSLAAGLLKDKNLLRELQVTAKERHYDPYFQGR